MKTAGETWSPPDEFEEYRLIRPLGRGGMGHVYLAEDRLLSRLVAVKFIAAASPSESARERFFIEARAIARLSHPNVVAVHRVGEIRRRPYLVSEYVRGQSLAEIEKPVPWRRGLAIAIDLARGLAAAHRRGVLHRDIKPANAMISDEGTVKLLDFGLAELLPWSEPIRAEVPAVGVAIATHVDGALRTVALGDPTSPLDAEVDLRAAPTFPSGDSPSAFASTLELDLSSKLDEGQAQPPVDAGLASTVEIDPPQDHAALASTREPDPRPASPALVGTPAYMAPEIWDGQTATPRADVYALGVVIYELCFGLPPHDISTLTALIQAILGSDAPPLATTVPGVDPRFAAIVDRCLRRDASLRFADGDALREALEQIAAPAGAGIPVPEGNPYRGLSAFEAEHRGLFFGRGGEILGILDRLRTDPFVVIAGDSGTGKSSLCRAGVLPAAAGGMLGHPVAVSVAHLGRHPLSALASAIAPLVSGDEPTISRRLRSEPAALARELKQRHSDVLLFVDQLEELCTLADPTEANEAAEALHGLAGRVSGVRLLATARSDFLTRLSALAGLGDDLPAALYLLRPLTKERLREAVTGPAAAKGFSYESNAVVETLVSEALRAEGGLPLLQFALAEIWEARDETRKVIPASALQVIGGVTGALARHADGVIAHLPPPYRAAARAIVLALVTPEGTRAQRGEAELLEAVGSAPGARAALDALVRGRLLVAREAETGEGSAYTIAHEALLSGWDTLRGWLGHDVEGRALRQRLERAATEWERDGRATDALWGDRLLADAAEIKEEGLGAREKAFLTTARKAARLRRIARWSVSLGVPLAIGLVLVGTRIKAASDLDLLDREAQRRRSQTLNAEVDKARGTLKRAIDARAQLDERRREAFELFDAGDVKREQAERAWEKALRKREEMETHYADACGTLESVLRQKSDHEDALELLGDAIYERAELADRDGRGHLEDLVRQINNHDSARSHWNAPAELSIEISPLGAEVEIEGLHLDEQRWMAGGKASLGRTPIAKQMLPHGSVVLVFTAPGRVTVRLPTLLKRGETTRIGIDLPLETVIPNGFIYVPPGEFLYGTTSDEDIRHFFECQPMHSVRTDAYLIARNETTYQDWIQFLRSRPREDRGELRINVDRNGFIVALTEQDGKYALTFGGKEHPYSALEGRNIRYDQRDRRVSQDWLKFPVTGVPFNDSKLYASWLHQTGRVPGARPCTEHEWERAARGADGRTFPGGEQLDAGDANFDLTYDRKGLAFGPDEVGSHHASDSPFGVHDMAGNVWEWTETSRGSGMAVARGGSFFESRLIARVENRGPDQPNRGDPLYGFRICADPQP